MVVGLTGGIGSGKSTVARLLVERGAVLVDADHAARLVVEPGMPALDALVARFGPTVLQADGQLDRPALAAVAFADDAARADLNRITHPAVREEMLRQAAAAKASAEDAVIVMDVPLLAEVGRSHYPLDVVIVVDATSDEVIERLVTTRGYTEEGARARMAAQASREERRVIADLVLDNSGDLDQLRSEVDRAWAWIQASRRPA